MRFSEVQQKEIIEAQTGKFIGYIVDADVDEKTGKFISFHVAVPTNKLLSFLKSDEIIKKILVEDILVIGKDVILVRRISE